MSNSKQTADARLQPGGQGPDDRGIAFRFTAGASLLLCLYLLGAVFPDSCLWGVHLLAFIPVTAAVVILALLLLSLFPFSSNVVAPFLERRVASILPFRAGHAAGLAAVAIMGGFFFYFNRVAIDMYGDARTLLTALASSPYRLIDLLGFKDYEPLTRYIHQSVATAAHLDQRLVYQLVSAAAGGVFLAVYLWYVMTSDGSPLWRIFILISGVLCGANQLFFGYVEDYTLVYLCMIVFLISAWKLFDGKNALPWVLISFIVGIKLHVQMVLFTPSVVYLLLYRYSLRKSSLGKVLTFRNILIAVGASVVLCAGLYLFVFKAYRRDTGDTVERASRIFLPLVNYLMPPHNYTLLSWKHWSDVAEELLLVVSPGAFIFLLACASGVRSVWRSTPRNIFYGLALFYFVLFGCTVDPLLTPARDWDMLSLSVPAILFFTNSIAREIFGLFRQSAVPRRIVGISLAFGMIPLLFFFINSDQNIGAARLRTVGIWSFKSYYIGSAYILNVGSLLIPEKYREIAERERIIRLLEPEAAPSDGEIGFLYYKLAVALQTNKEYGRAEYYFKKALDIDATNASAIKALSVVYLLQWRFGEAAHLIERFNENLNAITVNDFQSLLIAHYAHRCLYLVHQQKDRSEIQSVLTDLETHFIFR